MRPHLPERRRLGRAVERAALDQVEKKRSIAPRWRACRRVVTSGGGPFARPFASSAHSERKPTTGGAAPTTTATATSYARADDAADAASDDNGNDDEDDAPVDGGASSRSRAVVWLTLSVNVVASGGGDTPVPLSEVACSARFVRFDSSSSHRSNSAS